MFFIQIQDLEIKEFLQSSQLKLIHKHFFQKEKNETFYVNTEVTFKPLSGKEISQYVKVINPLDKAGAYAAQDHGELIIEKYSGSFTNVVGLPMSEVKEALAHSFNTFPAT